MAHVLLKLEVIQTSLMLTVNPRSGVYSVSQKIPPRGPNIFSFFSQTVENL